MKDLSKYHCPECHHISLVLSKDLKEEFGEDACRCSFCDWEGSLTCTIHIAVGLEWQSTVEGMQQKCDGCGFPNQKEENKSWIQEEEKQKKEKKLHIIRIQFKHFLLSSGFDDLGGLKLEYRNYNARVLGEARSRRKKMIRCVYLSGDVPVKEVLEYIQTISGVEKAWVVE